MSVCGGELRRGYQCLSVEGSWGEATSTCLWRGARERLPVPVCGGELGRGYQCLSVEGSWGEALNA